MLFAAFWWLVVATLAVASATLCGAGEMEFLCRERLFPELQWDELYPDNTWAEVVRISAQCVGGGDHREGLSVGWPGDHDASAYSFMPEATVPGRLWPYGCFFALAAHGSGVFVNVGRSLRVRSHLEAYRALGIPCQQQANGRGDVRDFCKRPADKLFCHMALAAGYDSIQMMQRATDGGAKVHGELVVCADKCASESLAGACGPNMHTRDGPTGSTMVPCECDRAQHVSNCQQQPAFAPAGTEIGDTSGCVGASLAVDELFDRACRQGRFRKCVASLGGLQLVASCFYAQQDAESARRKGTVTVGGVAAVGEWCQEW